MGNNEHRWNNNSDFITQGGRIFNRFFGDPKMQNHITEPEKKFYDFIELENVHRFVTSTPVGHECRFETKTPNPWALIQIIEPCQMEQTMSA